MRHFADDWFGGRREITSVAAREASVEMEIEN